MDGLPRPGAFRRSLWADPATQAPDARCGDAERGVSAATALIRIPPGWFWMGSEDHYGWERPKHRVFVDAFDIAATTVTRGEYARFLLDTARGQPRGWAE